MKSIEADKRELMHRIGQEVKEGEDMGNCGAEEVKQRERQQQRLQERQARKEQVTR